MLAIGTLLLSSLLAASARAEAPRRVLIVDTVSFSPRLERGNARQKMLDAVGGTLTLHGWQAAPSGCHDFTCIGPAAAAAQANFALILTGTYGGEDLVADDVGVSLWRDGSVVARRTEADEKAEAEQTSAGVFFACGPPSGTCVAPLLASKMQQYSARLLDAETTAIQRREAATTKPIVANPPVVVAPLAPAAPPARSGVGGIVGWSLVDVGVVGLGGGIALWVYDHSGTDCHSLANSGCRQGRATGTAAAVVGGVGAAAAVAGIVVLVLDRDRSHIALSVLPGGFALGGRF
jgi:hypothetical protein